MYKLYPRITFDSTFADLVKDVREARKPHVACISAGDGIDIPELLQKIVNKSTYESDYKQITETLLFENVTYAEAITVLQKILDGRWFE